MSPRTRRILGVLVLLAAAPSCAAIVGDDFKIVDDKSSASSGPTGCAAEATCDACLQCDCPDGYAACASGTPCSSVLSCVGMCMTGDQQCIHDCEFNPDGSPMEGTNEAIDFATCACQGDCTSICTAEHVC